MLFSIGLKVSCVEAYSRILLLFPTRHVSKFFIVTIISEICASPMLFVDYQKKIQMASF